MDAIRDSCSNLAEGVDHSKDPLRQLKKDSATGYKVKIPERRIGPSSTQVLMIFVLLQNILKQDIESIIGNIIQALSDVIYVYKKPYCNAPHHK